jgi:hypothetical protein
MRLLHYNNDGEFSLTQFFDKIPRYAILSHTWGPEEVTFKDMTEGNGASKTGFDKIRFCEEQARCDRLQYFWVDTCCIDKSSSAELTEAINSMFRWYQNAVKCYVYLSDVSTKKRKASDSFTEYTWEPAFRSSKWFTRGWTLQELLAPSPSSLEFFSQERNRLGDKRSLEQQIHETTESLYQRFEERHCLNSPSRTDYYGRNPVRLHAKKIWRTRCWVSVTSIYRLSMAKGKRTHSDGSGRSLVSILFKLLPDHGQLD